MSEDQQGAPREAIIVGAGIGGLAMACFLSDQGYRVKVFDKRPDPSSRFSDGRSINFTLSRRGLHALELLGAAEEALAHSVKLESRVVHVKDRPDAVQSYGTRPGQAIYSIQRHRLVSILLDRARAKPGVEIFFEHKLESLDRDAASCVFADAAGRKRVEKARFVVGADGAFSTTRQALIKGRIVNFEQRFFDWIYKEVRLSAADARALGLSQGSLHVWPSHPSLLVGIPNPDETLSCLYATPLPEGGQVGDAATSRIVAERFKRDYACVSARAASLRQGMEDAPLAALVSVKVSSWSYKDKAVLIGDACHAIFPFYGQGMNAALEDCVTLAGALASAGSVGEAFKAFEAARKENTDALHEISQKNFLVMRDKADSALYGARVKVDAMLARRFPGLWKHEYEEIAHKLTPVKTVRAALRRQDVLRKASGIFLLDWGVAGSLLARRAGLRAAGAVRTASRAWLDSELWRPNSPVSWSVRP